MCCCSRNRFRDLRRRLSSDDLHVVSSSQASLLRRKPHHTLLSLLLHRCQYFSSTAELPISSSTWYVDDFCLCNISITRNGGRMPCRCATAEQRLSGLLTPRGAFILPLYMEVASVPPPGGLWAVSICWQAESDVEGHWVIPSGCGGSGPAVSRVGWVYISTAEDTSSLSGFLQILQEKQKTEYFYKYRTGLNTFGI